MHVPSLALVIILVLTWIEAFIGTFISFSIGKIHEITVFGIIYVIQNISRVLSKVMIYNYMDPGVFNIL